MNTFIKSQLNSIASTAVDFITTIVLVEVFHVWYFAAGMIGTVAGGLTNFTVGRTWVFHAEQEHRMIQFRKYMLVWIGSMLLNTSGLFFFTEQLQFSYILSKIIVTILVGIGYNYFLQKKYVFKIKRIFILVLLGTVSTSVSLHAQTSTTITGIVTDKKTGDPMPFVTVIFWDTNTGATTDEKGHYELHEPGAGSTQIQFHYLGYRAVTKSIVPGTAQVINIKLEEDVDQLNEVVVKGRRQKYRNKNNPAVDLINKVIEHKSENRSDNYSYYEYEKYEKMQFALSNVSEKFKNKKSLKNFQFIFENLDTTKLEGKPILPIYIKETISDIYYRKDPKKEKEIVKANKMVSFDGYIDNDGLNNYVNYLYQDVDIYDNNITMLTNQFLSPVSNVAPTFYRFFIIDTVTTSDVKLIQLDFEPRNESDFLFQGSLFITLDSAYTVQKVDMTVSKSINLNWVKELKIVQDFEKDSTGKYALMKDDFMADFGLTKGKMGIFGQRSTSFKNIKINQQRNDTVYAGDKLVVEENANQLSDEYWAEKRHETLTKSESNTYATIDSVKQVPAFKRTMNIAILLLAGYKTFKWFEIGPVNTFYSFNPVEGFKLRFGGRTTTHFSKRINFETYGAYGFKDDKWKYYLGTTYSFTKRSIYEFPVRSLKASYQRDTKIPGQELQFVQEDNFLLSFKRGPNDKWLYNDFVHLDYLHEFKNHFSFTVGYKYWQQTAAGALHFNYTNYNDRSTDVKNLTTSEFMLNIRWAPNEKFYQGKIYRIPIFNKWPIFNIRYIAGVKGVFNSEYSYHNVSVNMFKRFYLSQLGYTDVVVEGGQIFGTVPFPLLDIHRANQTYSYQFQSYNLMNFLEFVSDRYVSLNIDHYFNGFIFNKIPLLKKVKLREVATFKILYGDLSKQNDPAYHPDLYRLPVQFDGTKITHTLAQEPYIEGSVGIANIFKFFRIDLVKRFTYLYNPNVSSLGIRARFRFDF
ncbi:MAG: carboxypeptidase-like regulatory protein [Chitinophagaceae bacterium]|nr:carboxypeptidase-like regulatory protein [Chitinophagaceae bacterium]